MATFPLAYRQAATNAVVDRLDVGAGANATLEIGTAGFASVLLIFQLENPAFGAADGTATASLNITTTITTTGEAAAGAGTTAVEYRYKDRDGADGPSGTIASGEVTISNATVVAGATFELISAVFNNP